MPRPSERLAELGIVLPPVAAPVAAYVPALLDGEDPVPLYRLRTRKGREVPVEAGVCYHAESGRMVICRFPSGFRAMLPVAAVRAHYADPDANRPTRIATPADELEPAPAEAAA